MTRRETNDEETRAQVDSPSPAFLRIRRRRRLVVGFTLLSLVVVAGSLLRNPFNRITHDRSVYVRREILITGDRVDAERTYDTLTWSEYWHPRVAGIGTDLVLHIAFQWDTKQLAHSIEIDTFSDHHQFITVYEPNGSVRKQWNWNQERTTPPWFREPYFRPHEIERLIERSASEIRRAARRSEIEAMLRPDQRGVLPEWFESHPEVLGSRVDRE